MAAAHHLGHELLFLQDLEGIYIGYDVLRWPARQVTGKHVQNLLQY